MTFHVGLLLLRETDISRVCLHPAHTLDTLIDKFGEVLFLTGVSEKKTCSVICTTVDYIIGLKGSDLVPALER